MTLLVVALSAFIYTAIGSLGAGYQSYRETVNQASVTRNFVGILAHIRINAYTYRANPSPERRSAVLDRLDTLITEAKTTEIFERDSVSRNELDDIVRLAQDFGTSLDRFASETAKFDQLKTTRAALEDKVLAKMDEIRLLASDRSDSILVALQSEAQQNVLLGLNGFAQFIIANDPTEIELASSFLTHATESITRATNYLDRTYDKALKEGGVPLLAEVAELIAQLSALGPQFLEAASNIDEISAASLDKIGPEMLSRLETIASHISEQQARLGDEGQNLVETMQFLAPVSGAVATLVALIAALVVSAWITRPLNRLVQTTSELASGRTDIFISGAEHKHELGKLARALEVFRQAHIEREATAESRAQEARAEQQAVVIALSEGLERLAAGDLGVRVDQEFPEEYEALRKNFNATVSNLEDAIGSVVLMARQIESSAEQINSGATDLSGRTEDQASTLQGAAAALEQLTASVTSSASQTKDVEATIELAREDAKKSTSVVKTAIAAMDRIQESSEQITQITAVISDIAFQTNLLALNAGVEAARAGAAGSGFAVVASEIGALANRSSEAAGEVNKLITASTEHVADGTASVNGAGAALHEIICRVEEVTSFVSTIAESSYQQASGISEINTGIADLDRVTQQNASLVVSSTQQGKDLASHAGRLAKLVDKFKLPDQPSAGLQNSPEPMLKAS